MDSVAPEHAAEPPAPAARRGLRTYYVLLVAQTVSLLGSQISSLSVSIWVYRQTGHVTPLALVAFFQAAPMILLGGFAGALADRYDRRSLMIIANVALALLSALLLASFASGVFQLWQLYALTLAGALAATLGRPAFQASIAMLVRDAHRDRANAFGQMTGPAAGVIAPTAAGLLYALVGVVGSIAIDIASFLVAIATLIVVRIPMPAATGEGGAMRGAIWGQGFDGFRYLAARPVLLGLCGYIALVNFLLCGVLVLDTPYILARAKSAALLGLVMGGLNLGAVAGALAMGVWGGARPRIHTVMTGILVESVAVALAGVARDPVQVGGSLFLFMLALPFVNAAFASIVQAKVAPDLQGRVFAVLGQIAALLTPAAYLIAGPLADKVFETAARSAAWGPLVGLTGAGRGAGMGLMFLFAGVLVAMLTLAVYGLAAIRRMEATLPDAEAVPADQ